jgi:hypothetical protein
MSSASIDVARTILGDNVLGPEEVAAAFGVAAADSPTIPFSKEELAEAHARGEMLVLRCATAGNSPLTIRHMIEVHPSAFDGRFLRGMGYQLKDEWGIELEPCAATETVEPGWALVRKTPLLATLNLSYEQQEEPLRSYAQQIGAGMGTVRRRSGVEIVYDLVLNFAARGSRLLEKAWDWSSTRTVDGGYLNVGGFGNQGMQVLSYSRAVRHGALGVCPTRYARR